MTIFTTQSGRELTIKPVSRLLTQSIGARLRRESKEAGEPLDAPTYEVTTVAGVTETHPHDEDTLDSDEDNAAWQSHLAAQARFNEELNRRIIRAMVIDGIVGLDTPNDEWLARLDMLGAELPDDPIDRQVAFLQMEYLPDPGELSKLLSQIMGLSLVGVSGEEVAAASEAFRSQVEGEIAGEDSDSGE